LGFSREYWLKHKGRLPPTKIINDDPELLAEGIVKVEIWDYGPNFETDPEIVKHFKRTITIHEHFTSGAVSSIHLMMTPSSASTTLPDAGNVGQPAPDQPTTPQT
jgi:hypothetical protein